MWMLSFSEIRACRAYAAHFSPASLWVRQSLGNERLSHYRFEPAPDFAFGSVDGMSWC